MGNDVGGVVRLSGALGLSGWIIGGLLVDVEIYLLFIVVIDD
jgi:hypothetical protein